MGDGYFSTARPVPLARVAAGLLAVVILAGADTAFAKSETLKIDIAGETLATPIAITDKAVLARFHIWTGPGVPVPASSARPADRDPKIQERMFIDWPRGEAMQRPAGLPRYQVTFHVGRTNGYVVSYEIDRATGRGYFYLPRPTESLEGRTNTALIYHGAEVEGRWFHASETWDRLVGSETLRHSDRSGAIRSRSQSRAVLYQ